MSKIVISIMIRIGYLLEAFIGMKIIIIVWKLLEEKLYGSIGAYTTDNVISTIILLILYLLFKYRKERNVLIEAVCEDMEIIEKDS